MKLTGETLRGQRETLGLSQAEISKRSGISRQTIIGYEKKDGRLGNLSRLLEAYCLEVYPIVGSIPADIKEIEGLIKTMVEKKLGVDCKVKINIELFGGEK